MCAGLIESRSGKTRTCSKACSIQYYNDRRATRKREQWIAKNPTCASCDVSITDRRAGTTYCSTACKSREHSARWRERSPHYMRQYLYGITADEYHARLESQGGACAICRTDTPGGKGSWHVDHCHATGAIRGLLCHHCNLMLGNAGDDAERLRAAADYIEAAQ